MKAESKQSLSVLVLALVGLMFFLSGAAALVYEIVWTRMFSMAAGGNTRSLTAVLAAYMGGLALGSWLGGRLVDRRASRPILIYGWLEGLVGLTALGLTLSIPALVPALKLGREVLGYGLGFDLFRFLLSALFLVIPTTLMGATFPVLLRGVLSNRDKFGQAAGVLYGANTLGAMSGSLLAGFYLIPTHGFLRTVGVAAGANLLLLVVVVGLPGLRKLTAPAKMMGPAVTAAGSDRRRWFLLGGYALSGLCAMVYQVGWARSLTLTMGSSTYALSVIFAAYIGGLALGGLLMAPWADRRRMSFGWAAGLELAIGLSALLVMPFFEQTTVWMFKWTIDYNDQFRSFQLLRFGAAFALILAPTAAMGALLPVVMRIAGRLEGGVGEPAGRVYAANTLGAIAGAVLATHVFIRLMGIQNALLLATGLSVSIGVVWLALARAGRLAKLAGAAAAAAAVVAMVLVPRWDPIIMNSGPFIYANVQKDEIMAAQDLRSFLHNSNRVIFQDEGVEATVSVFESRVHHSRFLRINGKTDASDKSDMPTQVLSAHIPLLLHPHPKKVMVVGLASGVTSGSALLHPLERLEVLEISPEVVQATHYFEHVNHLDFQDPRFHVIIDDGRSYLTLSDEKYDVITAELSNAWVSGMSQLFTREFYTIMRDHLEPGGLAVSWIGMYDMDPAIVAFMMRTFSEVFPYCTVWESVPGADYLLVGSMTPILADPSELDRRAAAPAIARDLGRIDINSGREILARFLMGTERIKAVVGPGPVQLDDRLQLEYLMPRVMDQPRDQRLFQIYRQVLVHHEPASKILMGPAKADQELMARYDVSRSLFYRARFPASPETAGAIDSGFLAQLWNQMLAFCGPVFPRKFAANNYAVVLAWQGEEEFLAGRTGDAIKILAQALELDPENVAASHRLITYYQDRGDLETAVSWARLAIEVRPGDPLANTVLALKARSEKDLEGAERYLLAAIDGMPEFPDYRLNYGLFLAQLGRFAEAEGQLRKAVELKPDSREALQVLARVLKDEGKNKEAGKFEQRAAALQAGTGGPKAP